MDRYSKLAQQVDADGVKFVSGLQYVDFLYSGRIIYHTVEESEVGRLDLIAYKCQALKDPSLWYVIALLNGIFDPLSVQAGDQLIVPVDPVSLSDFEPFTYVGAN
jgi:hypothetical protein